MWYNTLRMKVRDAHEDPGHRLRALRPDAVNAAWEAVSRLPEVIGGAEILKRQLPVEYEPVLPG